MLDYWSDGEEFKSHHCQADTAGPWARPSTGQWYESDKILIALDKGIWQMPQI